MIGLIGIDTQNRAVNRVTTRAVAAQEMKKDVQDAITVAKDGPKVKLCEVNRQARMDSDVGSKKDKVVGLEDESDILGIDAEENELNLCIEQDSSEARVEEDLDLGLEECYALRRESRDEPEMDIPCVKTGSKSREKLIAETKSDPTLERWRDLASKGEQGLVWKDDIISD